MVSSILKIENAYTSSACNRTPHAADWGNNGLICYGACNAVAIYNPKSNGGGRVVETLTGHKGRVNAVKWVRTNLNPETELVSVSTDHCGLIWRKTDDTYIVSDVLRGHLGPVTVVDAIYHYGIGIDSCLWIATASVDSSIRIWVRQNQAVECRQVISLGSDLCLSINLVSAYDSLMLASGLDDCHIHLYCAMDGQFSKQQVLSGHEDWVTSLEFTTEDGGDLLLASGSQDSTVRLWRLHPPHSVTSNQLFHVEEKLLNLGTKQLAVGIESVLLGHDGRIYGVAWHPRLPTEAGSTQPLQLLTASLDKTVVVWSPEEQSGVWLEQARMGEVGGNTLGFYGACFGPQGSAILAHSYQGGFHMWNKHEDKWRPAVVVGGHFDAVSDIAWEPQFGRYVLSVSSDQTTRLHAPWLSSANDKDHSWHEIARPQIHGYDLVCLAMLPGFRFASGADEKVVRTFAAPQNFLENFKRLCVGNLNKKEETEWNVSLPTGAAVPVLGLSNKAVFQNEVNSQEKEKHVKDQYDENSYFTPQHLVAPPTEDILLQNTLWPETMKLYGHGYEVFSLASTRDGKLLASACKATNELHAAILLWDTQTWHKIGRLVSHQLTVTQMQFSPDDQFLLSVSRDRCWSVFQKCDQGEPEVYKLVAKTDKSTGIHTRIIWCCGWSHDSVHFATGSRDGKLVVWGREEEEEDPVNVGKFSVSSEYLDLPKESITSVAFGMDFVLSNQEYLIAIGSEAGDIRLYGWSKTIQLPWRFLFQLSGNFAHHLTVKRLAFRPVLGQTGKSQESRQSESSVIQLASCGLDNLVKVYDIYVHCNKV